MNWAEILKTARGYNLPLPQEGQPWTQEQWPSQDELMGEHQRLQQEHSSAVQRGDMTTATRMERLMQMNMDRMRNFGHLGKSDLIKWFDILKLQINIPKQKVRMNKPKKIEEEESGCREKMKRFIDTWMDSGEVIKSETLEFTKVIWGEYFEHVYDDDKITIENATTMHWTMTGIEVPSSDRKKLEASPHTSDRVFNINVSNRNVVDETIGNVQFEGSKTEELMEGVPESVACKFLELLNTATGKTEEWEQSFSDVDGWDLLGFTRHVPERNRFGFTVITTGVRTQSKSLAEDWYEVSYLFELDPYYLQGVEDSETWSVYDDALLARLLKRGWQQMNSKVRSML
tara:strand:+ start:274 stop:1305 length:1032 start_codon:yes stop_codon:yes gene_type:complete